MVIALSYNVLPHSQARVDAARARGESSTSDEQFWRDTSIDIYKGVVALRPVVWSDSERKALDESFANEPEGKADQAAPTQAS
jgi:hypothetical protein